MTSSLADVEISVVFDCYPQKTVTLEALFLASKSLVFLRRCREAIANGTYSFHLPAANESPFRLALKWMEKREVDTNVQTLLVLAWNFGGDFDLTDFQNDVMRKLFHCLEKDDLDPAAVAAAWAEGFQADYGGSFLQQALSRRLAYSFTARDKDPWPISHLTQHGLHRNFAFLSEFVIALCAEKRNATGYRFRV